VFEKLLKNKVSWDRVVRKLRVIVGQLWKLHVLRGVHDIPQNNEVILQELSGRFRPILWLEQQDKQKWGFLRDSWKFLLVLFPEIEELSLTQVLCLPLLLLLLTVLGAGKVWTFKNYESGSWRVQASHYKGVQCLPGNVKEFIFEWGHNEKLTFNLSKNISTHVTQCAVLIRKGGNCTERNNWRVRKIRFNWGKYERIRSDEN
jgi:hypothetical protein